MNFHGEKCSCGKAECTQESDSSNSDSSLPKDSRKSKISLTSLGLNLRRGRSLKNKRIKKTSTSYCCVGGNSEGNIICANNNINGVNKKTKWPLKFYSCRKGQKPPQQENQSCCKCTCYKQTEEQQLDTNILPDKSNPLDESTSEVVTEPIGTDIHVPDNNSVEQIETPESPRDEQSEINSRNRMAHIFVTPNFIDLHWRSLEQEDVDEEARIQRAREIERGVDPPASFRATQRVQLFCSDENEGHVLRRLQIVCPNDVTMDSIRAIFQNNVTFRTCPLDMITGCHTQVDFIHCLVPDLLSITNCSFYWGKMDRYEAERLLEGKREGTFLLRDSAQEEFLFSVSFRKYGRSLHARIEQWNHKFSFDSHDPGVYTSNTVCGLIEHYKDPSSCMFFEPMLTWPLHRNFVFSLQHLCRANIVNRLTYDDVNQLQLPKSLKTYLKEYHYRQKVRVERFDDDVPWVDMRKTSA